MAAHFTTKRFWLSGVPAVALVVLAVGVSQGLAGSRGDGSATAPILYHNRHCVPDPGKRFIGTATFTLKGDILTVRVKVHGADPGDYVLSVHPFSKCSNGENIGKFKVDASGDGEKSGSLDVSRCCSGRSFVADAAGAGHNNISLPVNL